MARIPSRRLLDARRARRRRVARTAARRGAWLALLGLLLVAWVAPQPWRGGVLDGMERVARSIESPWRGSDHLLTLRLRVDPRRVEAARTLDRAQTPDDGWWTSATLRSAGRDLPVRILDRGGPEAELADRPWLIEIDGGDTVAHMRSFEIEALAPADAFAEAAARELLHRLRLPTAPMGFASWSVNGTGPRLVVWREAPGDALLERLGMPPGKWIVPTSGAMATGAPESRATRTAKRRLAELQTLAAAPEEEFAARVGAVLDVPAMLRLRMFDRAWVARRDGTALSVAGWIFDPVSGRLAPWIARSDPDAPDADALARQLGARLESPRFAQPRRRAAGEVAALSDAPLDLSVDALANLWPAPVRWIRESALRDEADLARATLSGATRTLSSRARSASTEIPVLVRATDEIEQQIEAAAERRATSEPRPADIELAVEDRTWVLRSGHHRLRETLVVPPGIRLRLEPGVVLEMDPGVSILTTSALDARGTRERPIAIRRASEGAWGAIGVLRADQPSQLSFVTIEGGSEARFDGVDFPGQLSFNASPLHLDDSEVRAALRDGLSVRGAAFRVDGSRFLYNRGDGLDAEWSRGSIRNSLFAANADDGLDLASSEVSIDDSRFLGMGDKAVSVGERSRAAVVGSELLDSPIAIASKEDSSVVVKRSEIRRNGIGIALYRDKPIFGDARGRVSGGIFAENGRDFRVDPGSELTLSDVARRDGDAAGAVGVTIGQSPGTFRP